MLAALETAAPAGLVALLKGANAQSADRLAKKAHPHIVGYATAAAAADAVPVAGAVAVPAVQSKMLHSLALIYGVEWNRKSLGEFAACLGVGAVSRLLAGFGLRELAKLIPVYGQTVRRRRRRDKLCHHLRHRQGCLLLPIAAPSWRIGRKRRGQCLFGRAFGGFPYPQSG